MPSSASSMVSVSSGVPPADEAPDPPDPPPSTLASPPRMFSSVQLLLLTFPLSSHAFSLSVPSHPPPPPFVVSSPDSPPPPRSASSIPLIVAPSRDSLPPSFTFATSPPPSVFTDPPLYSPPTSGLWSSSHDLSRFLTPQQLKSSKFSTARSLGSGLFSGSGSQQWYLEAPPTVRVVFKLMGLKVFFDLSTPNSFNCEVISALWDYASTACVQYFTALCRIMLSLQPLIFRAHFPSSKTVIRHPLTRFAPASKPSNSVYAELWWSEPPTLQLTQPTSSSFNRMVVCPSPLRFKRMLVSSRGLKMLHGFKFLEWDLEITCSGWVFMMVCVNCSFRSWWRPLVASSPTPPEPPDPPDYFISSHSPCITLIFGSTVLTFSSLGDMSIVTARASTASTPPSNHSSLMLVIWIAWCLDSSPLPLFEDRFTLPLYHFILPLYEDRSTLPLYEEFVILPLYEDLVTLPLYEDLDSFTESITFLCSLFVLNGCATRGVIKGSFNRCLYTSVAILEIGNCALVAVSNSGVRSSAQGVILLNNSTVEEIRGLLEDFYLFKCYVAIIFLCLCVFFAVVFSFYAMVAMLFGNSYSVFGD